MSKNQLLMFEKWFEKEVEENRMSQKEFEESFLLLMKNYSPYIPEHHPLIKWK